jgi:GT2 family glycosyltransferase
MNILSGKKVLCFIALPHHNRFLVPIMEALSREDMEVVYFTAAAEGAFEITLNQAGLPYKHLFDYVTNETADRTAEAYRELRSILQDKILGSRTMQSVPIVIQDKVIRGAVETFVCIQRMLEVEKPALLFALHELNPWGKILGYLSQVHRIPYFTLQEGQYYADIHYYRFHTDYSTACLVWGQECREILLRAGCSDDKIFPLGNTHIWDAKKEFADFQTVARTRQVLGIAPDKKIILFLMSHSHYRTFEAQPFLRWIKARGDIVALFKWHPVTAKEIIDKAMEKLQGEPSILNVPDYDTYALIGASDVCVTVGNSTTGLEALVFGKPLIEVRLPDQPYSYSVQKVAEQAFGFEDISGKIETILAQGLSTSMVASVERYLGHNFAYRDQGTMKRIIDLVKESVAAQAGELRPLLVSGDPVSIPCSIVLPVDACAPEELLATLSGIASTSAPELYEVLIVKCTEQNPIGGILETLGGDVKIISGEPEWSYGDACNRAVSETRGKYLAFLKPGMIPEPGWLEGLLETAEEDHDVGIVGGQVLNKNRLLWHIGLAFDVNQSPFSIYRFLPPEFSGAQRPREFQAVEFPFLVAREIFCRLGGFSPTFSNRFEDIDFCLKIKKQRLRVIYTPRSVVVRAASSWESNPEQDQTNRIRFYSKWAGSLWQDDGDYLWQDGLTHDALSALYRELAGRVARGVSQLEISMDVPPPNQPT